MPAIFNDKMTARLDGDFVVFLIGARVGRWWKVHKWLPIARAMPRMLRELDEHPELGLLHADGWFGRTSIMVQYWRSLDHLLAYARGKSHAHLPAWRDFYRRVGNAGDVGVWHETYLVKDGCAEALYSGMPRFGLAMAGEHVPAVGKLATARGRLSRGGRETHEPAA